MGGAVGAQEPGSRHERPDTGYGWSGPLDLLAALKTHPDLADLVLHKAVAQAGPIFDERGGDARNHDLVLHASTANGEPVAIFVEGKAGESLGETVAK